MRDVAVSEAPPTSSLFLPHLAETGPLRLRATGPGGGTGTLDGAWWPRSQNLRVEAEILVEQFPSWFDRICRVVYSSSDWPDIGILRFHIPRGVVTLHPFARAEAPVVMLRSVSSTRVLQLLVVPPHWEAPEAELVMEAAADPMNRRSGRELLDQHRASMSAAPQRPVFPYAHSAVTA